MLHGPTTNKIGGEECSRSAYMLTRLCALLLHNYSASDEVLYRSYVMICMLYFIRPLSLPIKTNLLRYSVHGACRRINYLSDSNAIKQSPAPATTVHHGEEDQLIPPPITSKYRSQPLIVFVVFYKSSVDLR